MNTKFSEIHIIRTLIEIKKNPIGRKILSKRIGISEGSMRSMLDYLKEKNFIMPTKNGHILTSNGNEMIDKFLKFCSFPFKISLPDMTDKKCVSIILKNASKKIKNGITERDIAVKEGCDGAFIFVYENNEFKFPNVNISVHDFPASYEVLNDLARKNEIKEGDVLVVCFADDYITAEKGVIKISTFVQNLNFILQLQ